MAVSKGGVLLLLLIVSASVIDVEANTSKARLRLGLNNGKLKKLSRVSDPDEFLQLQTQAEDKEKEEFAIIGSILIGVLISAAVGGTARAAGNAAVRERLAANAAIRELQEAENEKFDTLLEAFQTRAAAVLTGYQKAADKAVEILRLNEEDESFTLPDAVKIALARIVVVVRPDLSSTQGRLEDRLRYADGEIHDLVRGLGHDVLDSLVHTAAETAVLEGLTALGAEGVASVLGDVVLPGIGAVYSVGKLGVNLVGMSKASGRTKVMETGYAADAKLTMTHLTFRNCRVARDTKVSKMELDGILSSVEKEAVEPVRKQWDELLAAMDAVDVAIEADYGHDICKPFFDTKRYKKAGLSTCLTPMTNAAGKPHEDGLCCPITQLWFTDAAERGADYPYKLNEVHDHVRTVELSSYHETHMHARAPPCSATEYPPSYVSSVAQITSDGPVEHVKDLYSNGPFNRRPHSPVFFTEKHSKEFDALHIADDDDTIPKDLIKADNFGVDKTFHMFAANEHVYMLQSAFPGMPIVNVGVSKDEHHPEGKWTHPVRDLNGGPSLPVWQAFQMYTPPAPAEVTPRAMPAEFDAEMVKVADYVKSAPANAVGDREYATRMRRAIQQSSQ